MRKFYLMVALICSASCILNAQVRVQENGRVQVGTLKEDDDLQNAIALQVFGPNGDMRAGSKLSFGDFGRYTNLGWNVFIGEYGSGDSDQIWLHGKKGFYLTTEGQGSKIIASYNPSANANFVFNTNLRVNGVNITSDARLKENIQYIENPMGLLSQVNGITYNYNATELQQYSISDVNNISANDNKLSTSISSSLSSKEQADKAYAQEMAAKDEAEAKRKRIGFLAQDIQKVLPELVQTDEKGVMSIDYIGFIPLIVESLKELQVTIEEQNQQIEEQQELIENLQSLVSGDSNSSLVRSNASNAMLHKAKLYSEEGASVSYKLDGDFSTADLRIFDISGRLVKNIKLQSGNSKIELSPSEIGQGTFIYILTVDGQKVDSLKKYVG